jgi:hypothetical protein
MAVGYPLYQDEANKIAERLEAMAKWLREEPETLSFRKVTYPNHTEWYKLELQDIAFPFSVMVIAEGRTSNVDQDREVYEQVKDLYSEADQQSREV